MKGFSVNANKKIFSGIPDDIIRKRKKTVMPIFIKPMLATLTTDYFSSEEWFYEHKFDGVRCIAYKKGGKIRLKSRNNRLMNGEYPEIVAALEKQSADDFVIDGEIVAIDKAGISDFQLLQGRINVREYTRLSTKEKEIPIVYCIFDLMYVDGYDIRRFPLFARQKMLKKLFTYNKRLVFSQHETGNGIALFKKACALGWEGLMVKKRDGEYVGFRSRDWLKFKCTEGQELVIGGYTDPKGSRRYFGALLVGYYTKTGTFEYAGKVGTGFTQEILAMLGKKLKKLEIKKCPFSNYEGALAHVHWVRPVLVGEFQFAEWTQASKLRVGRYKGLRDDKNAKDVVKENPRIVKFRSV